MSSLCMPFDNGWIHVWVNGCVLEGECGCYGGWRSLGVLG